MPQECHEVWGAHDVDRAADAVAVKGRNRQRHVAAVAAAGHRNSIGIQVGPRGDPVEERVDVLVRVVAMEPIVQQRKCFSVAGRAAHVGKNQCDPQLV